MIYEYLERTNSLIRIPFHTKGAESDPFPLKKFRFTTKHEFILWICDTVDRKASCMDLSDVEKNT